MDARALQGAVGFVGITLGVLPLVQYLVTGRIGLWRFVVGAEPPVPWLYPVLVLVVAVALLAVLHRRERDGG
ncbi:hypothetical protein WIS52_14300 [Pseudonocardia nematodicida]|uniref:Uncharacterized protein n=1 Tax=Pseudonocardia nematodicida TaxID=1206997 RepID=A0ABV1KE71_9PSEU